MKKLGIHILGAILVSSLPVNGSAFYSKKRRNFDCYSDKKISGVVKKSQTSVHEFSAQVKEIDEKRAVLLVKRNYLSGKDIRSQTLTNEEALIDDSSKYLTIQGNEWALAIAPAKKRASLYNMNPDINEVPMFCLSPQQY